MAKYVPDVRTQRWVIVSSTRTSRPHDGEPKEPGEKKCPFCEESEHLTPPEVFRMGGGGKDEPGWSVRVVPNKYPITDIHEVIIHSPDHGANVENLPIEQVERILDTYKQRYMAHMGDGQVLIFCNHGMHAGASLDHPHSQVVVVPKQINLDALSREPINNVVEENDLFITYCPDFSQWPFEVWIAPKSEEKKYSDIEKTEVESLARTLQRSLQGIKAIYNDKSLSRLHPGVAFGYNYYISHGTNWFIRIIPRFVHRAGFELGTGLNVNIVDPVEATVHLKSKIGTLEPV